MSPTSDHDRSNPIKRAFSKFFERGDVSKPKDPGRTSPTTPNSEARSAPRSQAVRTGTPSQPARSSGAGAPQAGTTTAGTLGARPAAGATAADAGQPRTYTVQKGDSLSKIAQQVYGRADKWHAIFDANRDRIDDPDLIHPGQVLVLPDAPKLH